MSYGLIILLSYLVGSSNMALYLGKSKKVDMQQNGTGNLGASNATMLLGWGAGVLVALHDVGKTVISVLLAKLAFPKLMYAGVTAGVASILGHMFPFYNRFRGGKGLASFIGMTLALNWKLGIGIVVVGFGLAFLTDCALIGSATAFLTVPVYMGITTQDVGLTLILVCTTVLLLWRHRENFARVLKGTEFGFRSGASGKHRVK